jgi:hypothetical protein
MTRYDKAPFAALFLCALNLALWGRKVLNDGDDFTFVIG